MYNKQTRVRIVLGIACAALLAVGGGLWFVARSYRPAAVKGRIEALLSDQLESEVSIQSLEGTFFPRVSLSGGGMVIRHKGRTDVPPLISIDHFEIRADLRELMKRPRHVSEVRLQGLQVHLAPSDDSEDDAAPSGETDNPLHDVTVDRFEAPDTVLTLIPARPNKPPKVFAVHHLVMEKVGRGHVIPYIAVLTNPVPLGQIEVSGTFGPWNTPRPARSRVTGKYVFANADLDTIDGLSGVLSSQGSFEGPLNRIRVQGTTDTPKFQVDAGGQAVPLTTTFTAVVDGSDGNTYLDHVDAKFLDTSLTAMGKVVGIQGVPGRQVEMTVHVDNGRIEDLLRLAVDSAKPLLRGAAQFDATLVIPPRKAKVLDKMNLRGTFGLTQARFTDPSVQTKLTGLSRHGQGLKNEDQLADVMSNLKGTFAIENSTVTFPRLQFGVPGATVELSGRYGMRTQDMDFHGHLNMTATISQAAGGGIKSFFLKAVDPFFRKNGAGTSLPIKITGNRKDPKFGLEFFGKKK